MWRRLLHFESTKTGGNDDVINHSLYTLMAAIIVSGNFPFSTYCLLLRPASWSVVQVELAVFATAQIEERIQHPEMQYISRSGEV